MLNTLSRAGSASRLRTTTSVAAALLLAATAAIAPATASLPAASTTDGDAPSSVFDVAPDRTTSRAFVDPADAVSEQSKLESSPTIQEGTADSTRKPGVARREGTLYLSTVDGAGSIPDEQYVSRFELVQDVAAKKITITADYDAPPTADLNSFVDVYLGQWNSDETSCEAKGHARIAATGHGAATDALFVKGGTTSTIGTATRSLSGTLLTITATGDGAAAQNYECAFGYLDAVVSPTELKPLRRAWAEDFRAEMEKAPEFNFYSSELNAAYPKKWNKVRFTLRNDGQLDAKNVKVRLSGKKLSFKKKTIKLGTIKAGKRKDFTARVKLKGKKTRTLKVKATAKGKWSATTKTKVGYRPHPKKVRNLKGKSYWGFYTGNAYEQIWQIRGLHFINKNWVYVGMKEKGKLPKCSAKVKGCAKYSYSSKTGKLKIGKLRANVDSEGIVITKLPKKSDLRKGMFFSELKKPKKNTRYNMTLSYYDGRGQCFTGSCSSWWRYLTLRKNGTFEWTRGSISTIGFPPYQTIVSTSGPDDAGTYKILSKGRIEFRFTDSETGKKKREVYTIGIDADAIGKYNAKKGLVVGAMPHTP